MKELLTMRKHNILVVSNNKDLAAILSKNLAIRGCAAQNWTGLENVEEATKFKGLILTNDLYSHWSGIQHPDKIASAIRAKGISTPIFLACFGASDESLAAYKSSNLFNDVFSFTDNPPVAEQLAYSINKHLGPRPLDIGISGVGNFGYTLLGELKNASFINSIGVHSEFYRSDYSNLWKLLRVEGSNLNGFSSLEEMMDTNPDMDCLGIFAGQHGQMAPSKGKETMDRSLGFFDTMPVLYPRLLELKKIMDSGKFKGFVVIESGPQEIIMQYMVDELGFPSQKVIGVSPDGFRARYELRKDLIEEWSNRYLNLLSVRPANLELETILMSLRQEYDSVRNGMAKNPSKFSINLDKLTSFDVEGAPAKHIAEQYLQLRDMSTNDIKLRILGGRSWPVTTDSQATVFGAALYDLLPKMKTDEARENLLNRIKEWGWLQASIVGKNGKPYFDSPDEVKKFFEDCSYCRINPNEYLFGYNPEAKIYMQGPLCIDMALREARWNFEAMPLLDSFQNEKLRQGIESQKRINKQRISEYKKKFPNK